MFVGMLDRLFCILVTLVFLQIPQFMDVYTHHLNGHVSELSIHVAAMKKVATASEVSLEDWVNKFISSTDQDFHRHGVDLHNMVSRWDSLLASLQALDAASPVTRPFLFIRHFNYAIAHESLSHFLPGVPLTIEALIYGLVGAMCGYLGTAILRKRWVKPRVKILGQA